ncbi:fused MFS/spermidine synthase [Candidatus Woesearchaeota archaeon]|nr:fused MFS/spermidine synthase [Candidatus Woesearchaeota archaeon]
MERMYETKSDQNVIGVYKHGDTLYLKFNGGSEIQSQIELKDPFIQPIKGSYWNYFAFFPLLKHDIKDVLILGFGAGTIPRQLHLLFPYLQIDAVEIDEAVIDVATNVMKVDTSKLTLIHNDARSFLKSSVRRYDLIILDAFKGGNVDIDLLNTDFYDSLKSHLNSGGILAGNYIYEYWIAQRYKQFFVQTFRHRWRVQIPKSYNYVIWASDVEYDPRSALDRCDSIREDVRDLCRYIVEKHVRC